MGWMFDTMAQQLFNLARKPAINELLGGRRQQRDHRSAGGVGHLDLHDRLGASAACSSAFWAIGSAASRR